MPSSSDGGGHRVLVVDDELLIVEAVAMAFATRASRSSEGHDRGRGPRDRRQSGPRSDRARLALPDIEGIEVARRLRARRLEEPAILFLTAKDTLEGKVEALGAGGDDYVTKPFSLEEIVARARAILRRTRGFAPGSVLRFADLVLDDERHEVFRGETPILLTATEFSLLRYFLLNPQRVVLEGPDHRERLARGDSTAPRTSSRRYVSYLRRKLDAAGPPLIVTVRQMGYMLAEPRS